MPQAPASGVSFTFFVFFAAYTGILGFYYHEQADYYSDSPYLTDLVDDYETRRSLLLAIAAILAITSFVFYASYKCLELQTMLLLRLVGNLAAMLIYLGYQAGVLSEDGLDSDAVKDYSFSNASDWGSTVAFACAFVFIAAFEINETVLCSRQITRWIVKFQVFVFWGLFAVALCISGEALLDDVDLTDSESIYSKLLIASAGASALAAFLFGCYCTCEIQEFLKLHMLFGGITVTLFVSATGYQSYEYRKDLQELLKDNEEALKHWVWTHNLHIASQSFLSLALYQIVGFDNYFFASQPKAVAPSADRETKTIQLELKL